MNRTNKKKMNERNELILIEASMANLIAPLKFQSIFHHNMYILAEQKHSHKVDFF